MKRKLFITTLIVGFLVVGAQTIAEEPDAHPLHGTWNLNYNWSSALGDDSAGSEAAEPEDTTTWTIVMYTTKFGSFVSGTGGQGWVLNPSPNVVLVIYTTGCKPIYYSKNFNGLNYMSGVMWCREGSGWGTWNATKQ